MTRSETWSLAAHADAISLRQLALDRPAGRVLAVDWIPSWPRAP